jgi:hypothetical protein
MKTPVGGSGMTCEAVRDRLPLHFYGAAEDAGAITLHLAACPACASEWDRTRAVLGAVSAEAAFPGEDQVDWREFAQATVMRSRAAEDARRRATAATSVHIRRWAPWGGLLAAAALLAVFVGVGLERRETTGPPAATVTTPVVASEGARFLQDSVARRGAARSLRDGRTLLLDLMQGAARCRRQDGSYDVALEKQKARDLLRRMNLYAGSFTGPGDRRLAELMHQLESMLLQVSELDDCSAGQAIHDLREAIERRQLLLRIDLVTRDMEEGGARA